MPRWPCEKHICISHIIHCHSSMPIESLAEARLIWRERKRLRFSLTVVRYIFRLSESKASVVCGMLKNKFASKYIRKIVLLI